MHTPSVGVDEYVDPKLTGLSCPLNGNSFPHGGVGAATSRPQHKAPLRGALCRVDILVDPYG